MKLTKAVGMERERDSRTSPMFHPLKKKQKRRKQKRFQLIHDEAARRDAG